MKKVLVPGYAHSVEATFDAITLLGGSGKNNEINDKAAELLHLSDEVLAIPHLNSGSLSEINYRLAWARTLLKNRGAIENSAKGVWSITPEFSTVDKIDADDVERNYKRPANEVKFHLFFFYYIEQVCNLRVPTISC